MSLLDASNDIKVFDNGEIAIKSEKIPNSNISDLLNKAINPYHKVDQLAGWEKFQSLLKETNVPRSLVVTRSNPPNINNDTTPKKVYKRSPTISTKVKRWTPYDTKQNAKTKKTSRKKD